MWALITGNSRRSNRNGITKDKDKEICNTWMSRTKKGRSNLEPMKKCALCKLLQVLLQLGWW